MKSTTIAKIFIDVALIVLYLELMYAYDAGPLFHEIAGIGIVGLFAVHYALNWKVVKAMFAQARKGKLSLSRWVLLISDIVLPFCTAFCVVTGLLVARFLFAGPCYGDVAYMHDVSANICLWIMVVHLVFHARFLLGYARQIMRAEFVRKAFGTVAACAMVGVLLGLCFFPNTLQAETEQDTMPSSNDSKTTVKDKPEVAASSPDKMTSSRSSDDAVSNSNSSSTEQITEGQAAESEGSTVPVCTLCNKLCPVTNLLCNRGVQWAQSNNYL